MSAARIAAQAVSRRRNRNLAQRYAWFTLGVAINSFAIALIARSNLGVGAISSVAYVLSAIFPLSFGGFTFIINMLFIVAQFALLRRDFKPVQLLQVAVNIVFSGLIDLSGQALAVIPVETVPARTIALLIGCMLLALGIAIEVAPNVVLVPGEGIVRAINAVSGKPFGSCKAAFDAGLVIVAAALSFVALGRLEGVGIGTVVSALVVGRIVNLINRRVPFVARIAALTRAADGSPAEAL